MSIFDDIASDGSDTLLSFLAGPRRGRQAPDDFLGWLAGRRATTGTPDFLAPRGARSYTSPTAVAPTSTVPTAMGRIQQAPSEPQVVPAIVQPPMGPQPVYDRSELVQYASDAALRVGLDPATFIRQINVESGFNPYAGSPAGAQGIAQIVPKWHPGVDPYDPHASLDYAAGLMAAYLLRYSGDYAVALAAYNAGSGAVEQYGGVPPFEETQRYIKLILG